MSSALVERAPKGARPKPDQRQYRPQGAARDLWASRDQEVVIAGPADTGKSRAALEKMHLSALLHAGMRGLIARKTRSSLTESALVTYEDKVLPPGSPIKSGPQREQRHVYRYPNGSEIVVGGLDDTQKIMSAEYDLIFVQECRELLEADWEDLRTRTRNGIMPYGQVYGDTNPDAPSHWIKRRAARGQLRMLEARHADNPTFTPERQAILDGLTGLRRKRLRDGIWAAAEGVVYENYDPVIHLQQHRDIPADWDRWLAIDFGFSNPFVCQWWAVDHDGRMYRYRELYATQTLVEDHAHLIRQKTAGEPLRGIICDTDAEDRATLERHLSECKCDDAKDSPPIRLATTAAHKDISPGIQAVATRLRVAGDGKPRLVFLRDSLIARDPLLDDRKLPGSTEEEIEAYVWPQGKPNPDANEVPVKANDHGMDAMRYMVATLDIVGAVDREIGAMMRTAMPMRQLIGAQPRQPKPGEWMYRRRG